MGRYLRSNKYQKLSDSQILERLRHTPTGEDLHFLTIEVEVRDLQDKARAQNQTQKKDARHSVLYYLFYLVLAALFLGRFGNNLF
ncbi:MAG: hypothetical protein P8P22_04710 [Porticoccaceae bacterium]|nr:hypothetical protein [Porticoccaceae bacterium]